MVTRFAGLLPPFAEQFRSRALQQLRLTNYDTNPSPSELRSSRWVCYKVDYAETHPCIHEEY